MTEDEWTEQQLIEEGHIMQVEGHHLA